MLLIDDEQAESLETDVALEQPMRADHDVDMPALESLDGARLRLIVDESRQHLDHDGEVLQPLAENVEVLLRQHRRRGEQRDLLPAHRRLEGRAKRQLRLAEPHVPAEQPVHRPVRFHIALDLRQRRDLVWRLLVRKGGLELVLPRRIRSEGDARPCLAHRVDLQKLLRHVLHDLARTPTRARPVRRPEPVQRGSRLAAQILLDPVEVFHGHEQPVALRVLELEVLTMRAIRLDQPHPLESRDPVIDVNDELVWREVERELAGHVLGPRSGRAAAT